MLGLSGALLTTLTIYARHQNHASVYIGNVIASKDFGYELAPNHEVTLQNVRPQEIWIAAEDEETEQGDIVTWIGS